MATANLSFLLPEDQRMFSLMLASERYYSALIAIREEVRKVWKYKDLSEDAEKEVDAIYQLICDHVSKSGVDDIE